MAESVDALVSNTSRFTPVPVRPRLWVRRERNESFSLFLFSMADDGKPTALALCGNMWYCANKFAHFHTLPHRLRLCHHPTKENRGAHLRCGCADFRDIYCSTCGLRCKVSARVCDLWSLHFDPGFEYLGEDCKFSLFLCGFVRVGSGVVQRVAARQTCLRVL